MEKEKSLNSGVDSGNFKSTALDFSLPQISLPRGGGAIRGIEEKFEVNTITGTSSFSIPLPFSPSRDGTPAIGLGYNSGSGNSPFGLGWQLTVPSIARKTEKKLPEYRDEEESDTFIISGAEDLVPLLEKQGNNWVRHSQQRIVDGTLYTIKRYRPRIESAFTRIEKWVNTHSGAVHWKTISSSNFHSYYGLTADSRVTDPADPSKVFEWMLCRTHDDKGNITLFEYKKEDFENIPDSSFEKNRINNCTQLYLKKILYGVKKPYYLGDAIPGDDEFMFHVIFDYGEHDASSVISANIFDDTINKWDCRKDAFSSYRPGFEVRTYRRCKRIFCFHSFDELPVRPYLTKSLELIYDDNLDFTGTGKYEPGFSFLKQVRHNGYIWRPESNAYSSKSLPEMEFSYQQHEWKTEVKTVALNDMVSAPQALQDKRYIWVDLFSEGIAGILMDQAGSLFYKSNLGNGELTHARQVSPGPSFNGLNTGKVYIQELEGDGRKYLVKSFEEPKGFFPLGETDEWGAFKNFQLVPNINIQQPNLRSLDLTGDGIPDLLVTEDDSLLWYEGLGEIGFRLPRRIYKEIDEERGPAIVFADKEQSIFLADMDGDGLTDIVRIRNGEICYWSNLGYGKFGRKVTMEYAPLFDHLLQFNPSYLRLADVDGSGTTDIIYLGKNDFRVWMNQNGNQWSAEPHVIPAFPDIHNLSDVTVLDFLGSGTACIVYSTAAGNQPVSFIDLMGSKKPQLLNGYINNCGKEVSIEYKSSTHFYLEDKKQGRKWVTKLPFPVHCIHKTRSEDKIRRTVFTCSYRYSHGYYDYEEREFRGFGRVEQLDTEEFSQFKLNDAKNVVEEMLHQPPVRSVSWFHTGAWLRNREILHQYKEEYFKNSEFAEYELPDATFPINLDPGETREAYRACKGLLLRVEVYADDNLPQSVNPYTASGSTVEIKTIQQRVNNKYASFIVSPSESVSYSYERDPSDPRISHSFILETNELGMPLKTSSVIYKRVKRPNDDKAIPDKVWKEQDKSHIVYREALYTKDIIEDDIYRLRVGYESKSYEIGGIIIDNGKFTNKEDIKTKISAAIEILFEEDFSAGIQKRLSAHWRSYFLKDDLIGPLAIGQLSKLGIGHKTFQLAFTAGLVEKYYNQGSVRVTNAMLTDAKYVHSEGDNHWWTQSGATIYPVNAKSRFYTPIGGRDVFGNESFIEHDKYLLLPKKTTDAIGNFSTVKNDYRILSPVLLTDPNMNRGAVETDELGLVLKSAVMGKDGAGEGDTLADPTAKMEYDLFNWKNNSKPNYVHSFAREKHGSENPRWQESYVYSDGGGGVIMTKAQAEPGKAKRWNTVTKNMEEVDANTRWVGNGRTIINNKGNPVKKYEPYFSTTFEYESEDALVETGMTPVLFYDAVGRNIKTEFSNGTFTKVEFDPWYSKSFDVNDTAKDSKWYSDRGSPDPFGAEPADPATRAAWLAAKHYNTPSLFHTDSIGRPVMTISNHGSGKTTSVFFESDPLGRYTKSFDQLNREVSSGINNMIGVPIYSKTAEKSEKWIFLDVTGRLIKSWNSLGREFRCTFDNLSRPVSKYFAEGGSEFLYEHIVYGDLFPNPDAIAKNMKGRVYQMYDQTGVVTIKNVDFKGNATKVERRLTNGTLYKQTINWNLLDGITNIPYIHLAAEAFLEKEIFSSSADVDALGRPILISLPDKSIVQPKYNEANYLDSIQVKIRGTGDFVTFLDSQDYDAKGQRQFARYGNNTITNYFYDPQTFRLTNLITKLKVADSDGQSIQNLKYTYDPVGNITQIKDDAQQTHFFRNAVVYPENKYEYDAIYQLKKATGREHAGLGGNDQRNNLDSPFIAQLPHENDATAVRNYNEQYEYDDCGNIKRLQHFANNANWNTRYKYEYEDDVNNRSNRLKATSLPADADGVFSATYLHDLHGNMTSMPHLSVADSMKWNFMDQLNEVNLGGGGTAYYVYGSGGNRIRKIIERQGGLVKERIYLGAVEIYRERQGNGTPNLERYTLHISDNAGRIAQVDTKTIDKNNSDAFNALNANNIRYEYSNHLGSATLETDDTGNVISYEEYHPYGTSAYRVSKPDSDLSLKRYRFSGKERDDETGFYYFGARFYVAWIGRWASSDPAMFVDGLNLFRYCRNNPINLNDPDGLAPPPSDLRFPISKENKKYLSDHSPEAGRILEREIETNTYPMNGSNYQFEGHIDIKDNAWFYTATNWIEVDSNGVGIDQGNIAGAAPGVGLYDVVEERLMASGAYGGQTFGGDIEGADYAALQTGGSNERTFWNRGGSSLVGGLVLLGAGLLTVFTAGAATPLLVVAAGTMATAGGIAVTTTSTIQLTASYSGATTAEQDRQTVEGLHMVTSLSSPLGLVGGTTGAMIADDPQEGLRKGAFVGNLAELGIGGYRYGMSRLAPGTTAAYTSSAPEIVDLANNTRASANAGTFGIAAHGAPGIVENAAGAAVPISELAPIIQSSPHGRVVILACEVGQDTAALQNLANSTGRSVTGFSEAISTWNTNINNVMQFPVSAGNPATAVTRLPEYLSPFLSLTPNVAAPAAAALGGAQSNLY